MCCELITKIFLYDGNTSVSIRKHHKRATTLQDYNKVLSNFIILLHWWANYILRAYAAGVPLCHSLINVATLYGHHEAEVFT
jgi:hypothetical protein